MITNGGGGAYAWEHIGNIVEMKNALKWFETRKLSDLQRLWRRSCVAIWR